LSDFGVSHKLVAIKRQTKGINMVAFRFKHIAAASMVALSGLSQAADLVVPTGTPSPFTGFSYQGNLKLSYGPEVMGALDVAHGSVSSYGGGVATAVKDTDGFFVDVAQTGVITSMTLDGTSGNVEGYTSSGGVTWNMGAVKSVSTGGTLTLTDLSVDFRNNMVFATLIGANGVGTINNFHLLDINGLTGPSGGTPCPVSGACTYPQFTTASLSLTGEGMAKISQSLGLLTLGRSGFGDPWSFGTLSTAPIPEPSTYVLMGIGLVGVLVARRRAPVSPDA
jgi:hypothetical protein